MSGARMSTSSRTRRGRLHGKAIVITGATSGIGEATARRFAAEGAQLIIAGRNSARGTALAAELGRRVHFMVADVTREADIGALIDAAVERFGRLDVLFNNAGAGTAGQLGSIEAAQVDHAMRLLFTSALLGIQHAARAMHERGGSIINNASIAAHRSGQGELLYSCAKAALVHLTRLAAVELGPRRIRVNAISPGAIATPVFWGGAGGFSDEANARKLAKLTGNLAKATALPRAGQPEDIAQAALFLASDESSFVSGHDLVVDGARIWQYHERAR